MNETQLLETIANLILQSITIWEDVHQNALTLSSEYNAFWGLLDARVRDNALSYQKQSREARIIPFSINHIKYYEYIMTKDGFGRTRGLHWREQLKLILADPKFRGVLSSLILELKSIQAAYTSEHAAINSYNTPRK